MLINKNLEMILFYIILLSLVPYTKYISFILILVIFIIKYFLIKKTQKDEIYAYELKILYIIMWGVTYSYKINMYMGLYFDYFNKLVLLFIMFLYFTNYKDKGIIFRIIDITFLNICLFFYSLGFVII